MQPIEFTFSYPVYMVFEVQESGYIPLLAEREEDGTKGVAAFTELLHAERARDAVSPQSEIQDLEYNDFSDYLKIFADHLGIHNVVFDPYPETGRPAAWLSSSEILSRGMPDATDNDQ